MRYRCLTCGHDIDHTTVAVHSGVLYKDCCPLCHSPNIQYAIEKFSREWLVEKIKEFQSKYFL
jgi:hypothetical protein